MGDAPATIDGKPRTDRDWADTLPAGTRVGRYVLLSRLGSGGAGLVFAAIDPTLERKVAIKVLRAADSGSITSSQGQARLLREAQAMARLKHPNVVPVYDVGTLEHDGRSRVFVAMELVDGGTLREWLKQPRTRREVLEVMQAAGRGLAAAHAAGLIHRDFKPDNVLLGRDGRVFVTDFGLVRSAELRDVPRVEADPAASPLVEHDSLSTPLTRADTVVGTPGYMAPEQYYMNAPIDPRTDQFSYCVTLYEALCGIRPFSGRNADQLSEATRSGRIDEPVNGAARVPAWLRRVALRGLSKDPHDRWPSMEALLDAMARDPAARRRRVLWTSAAVLTLGAAALLAQRQISSQRQLCRGAERKLSGVWDDQLRGRMQHAFEIARVDPRLYQSAAATLDEYARGFVSAHTEACEATRLRGEQPENVLALRMSCLETRRRELGALASVLASADRKTAQKSVEAAAKLSSLSACADVSALSAAVPPPADAATRAEVEALHGRLAQTKALLDSAQYKLGLDVVSGVLASSTTRSYDPLQAAALELQGTLLEQAGESKQAEAPLSAAVVAAYAGHDDRVVASAATELARVDSYWLGRHEDGHRWARLARAAIVRLGGADELEADRLRVEAGIFMTEGNGAQAVPAAERALALAEKVWGAQSIKTAYAHGTLAGALHARGDFAPAHDHHLRHLEILEPLLGSDHPALGIPINNLGVVADSQEKYEEAVGYYRRSLRLVERTLGPDHPNVAITLANIGVSLRALHRFDEALAAFQRALAIYDHTFPGDYPDAVDPLLGIGESLSGLRRPAEAIAPLERALRLGQKSETAPAIMGEVRFALARALWEAGRDHPRARRLTAEAREAFVKDAGPTTKKEADDATAWLTAHR